MQDDSDPLSEDEWPDDADTSDDDESPLLRCNECGRMIAEDSPRCPHCGTWGPADAPHAGRLIARIIWAIAVLLLIGIIVLVWHAR